MSAEACRRAAVSVKHKRTLTKGAVPPSQDVADAVGRVLSATLDVRGLEIDVDASSCIFVEDGPLVNGVPQDSAGGAAAAAASAAAATGSHGYGEGLPVLLVGSERDHGPLVVRCAAELMGRADDAGSAAGAGRVEPVLEAGQVVGEDEVRKTKLAVGVYKNWGFGNVESMAVSGDGGVLLVAGANKVRGLRMPSRPRRETAEEAMLWEADLDYGDTVRVYAHDVVADDAWRGPRSLCAHAARPRGTFVVRSVEGAIRHTIALPDCHSEVRCCALFERDGRVRVIAVADQGHSALFELPPIADPEKGDTQNGAIQLGESRKLSTDTLDATVDPEGRIAALAELNNCVTLVSLDEERACLPLLKMTGPSNTVWRSAVLAPGLPLMPQDVPPDAQPSTNIRDQVEALCASCTGATQYLGMSADHTIVITSALGIAAANDGEGQGEDDAGPSLAHTLELDTPGMGWIRDAAPYPDNSGFVAVAGKHVLALSGPRRVRVKAAR